MFRRSFLASISCGTLINQLILPGRQETSDRQAFLESGKKLGAIVPNSGNKDVLVALGFGKAAGKLLANAKTIGGWGANGVRVELYHHVEECNLAIVYSLTNSRTLEWQSAGFATVTVDLGEEQKR